MTRRAVPAPPPADPARLFRASAGEAGAVFLETQRPSLKDRYSYLLKGPERILSAATPDEVLPLLEEAGAWQRRGFIVAGFVAYEAGFALDGAFAPGGGSAGVHPLLRLGVYPGCLRYDHRGRRWTREGRHVPDWGTLPEDAADDPGSGMADPALPAPDFSMPDEEYFDKVEEVRRAIAAGDLYQANLTGSFRFPCPGDPFAFYLRLRAAQPVPYGAFLRTDAGCIVSQSPELFFRVRGGRIETCPMKGTAPRGLTEAEDRAAAAALKADPKNRAENVMIVDLLRNDLGRVCETGSIRVPRLFEVQRYRTVLQMVSTVTGRLKTGTTPASLFRALFPCGSITGAPKIASMRLLRRLEPAPRGVYTGAIGILLPDGGMTFSVAIRTVTVREGRAEAGAGGGIVWDSSPREELREIHHKKRFLVEEPCAFELIETFLWTPGEGFRSLPDHLRRISASARYFGFRFRREGIVAALESAVRGMAGGGPARVRLRLRKDGEASVALSPPPGKNAEPVRLTVSDVRVSSRDPFVRHKTTNRGWRDEARRKALDAGFGEILFLNERGELTEGAISNLFLEIGGRLYTPPASCGLLDGVCRKRVLGNGTFRAAERVLHTEDLDRADRLFLTNSVRGMTEAILPAPSERL